MFTLNIGTDIEQIVTLASVVLSIGLTVFAWKKVSKPHPQTFFRLAVILLPMYVNLKLFFAADTLLSPAGMFDIWFRHIFFYIGQWCFFQFVLKWFSAHLDATQAKTTNAVRHFGTLLFLAFLLMPHMAHASHTVKIFELPLTPYNVLLFVTDQGLQHILAILFFFFTIAITRTQAQYAGLQPLKRVLYAFFVANGFFIMTHVWEYLFESQHLFSFVDYGAGEIFEGVLQFLALFLFYRAIRRFQTFGYKQKTEAVL